MTIKSILEKSVSFVTDLFSTPIAFIITGLVTLIAFLSPLDRDTLNVTISVFTMMLGLAVLVSTRRGEIALHLKLDEQIEANEDMTNEAVGAEHETTEKLEEIKEEVENRC